MRILVTIVATAATLAAMSTSRAQTTTSAPLYYPWCAVETAADVVRRSCGFTSYVQCMESVRGQAGMCFENIWSPRPVAVSEPPSRRR
jgi:hypothetical protein